MPTAQKHRWIRALAEAGLKEIEVASFVPAKLLPQMADAAEVVRGDQDSGCHGDCAGAESARAPKQHWPPVRTDFDSLFRQQAALDCQCAKDPCADVRGEAAAILEYRKARIFRTQASKRACPRRSAATLRA